MDLTSVALVLPGLVVAIVVAVLVGRVSARLLFDASREHRNDR